MADYTDWSKLLYSGLMPLSEYEGGNEYFAPKLTMPDGRAWEAGQAGKYSDFRQNPFAWAGPAATIRGTLFDEDAPNPEFDPAAYAAAKAAYEANPTFSATRMDPAKTNDNQYQTNNFRIQTDPDGKQYLVPTGDWQSAYRDSGQKSLIGDLGMLAAVIGGGHLVGGLLGGAGAAAPAAGAATGTASGATNAALIESALGTPGYGASSAGLGGGAGVLAGGAAASAFDPVGAYLTSGAVDGSVASGMGGYAGAITGLPEVLSGGGLFQMPFDSAVEMPLDGFNQMPPMPFDSAVEEPLFGFQNTPAEVPPYSNEGRNYPTPASTQGPGGSPINSAPIPAGGLLGDAGKWLVDNPGLAKLIGTGLGGLLGKAIGGPKGEAAPAIAMNARAVDRPAATLRDYTPSQGLSNGLGASSAGLFDEYMKKQLQGGQRTFYAPTFGGKP